ncbi:MAG: AAA family ATPase [Gemmatimonadetes bacterium]|nr:AAA family ATPase [Gemmatimonadota bacterium]
MARLRSRARRARYAARADRIEAAATIEELAGLDPGPPVLADPAFGAALPRPVLWRAGGDPGRGALIGAGEVAILAGPGQGGKSTIAIALAHAAGNGGEACGLHVARGKVAMLSYEDSPARLAHRMA